MTNYNQELATEIHNQALQAHEELRNEAPLWLLDEILFGSEARDATIGLKEVILINTIIKTDTVRGIDRPTPVIPISKGKYKTAYKKYRNDPNFGKWALEDVLPILSEVAEKKYIKRLLNS